MSSKSSLDYTITPKNIPNDGIMFVNHEINGRSGHGGNCLTQCKNGDILSFYSNVSGDIWNGHGVAGWSEYKISKDGGLSWSEPKVFEYSKNVWKGDEFYSALVFSTVTTPNGTIIAIAVRFANEKWIKKAPPVYLLSHDHGRTWSKAIEMDSNASLEDMALTFDASFVHKNTVYAAFFGDMGNMGYGTYCLYASSDNGETFQKRSVLPFDPANYYITAGVLDNGSFIVYSYPYRKKETDEYNMHYVLSKDNGFTWSQVKKTYFAKRIRNPQMSEKIGDYYFLHGRSGSYGDSPNNFVLYASVDGINWDEGVILHRETGTDSYSGNVAIRNSASSKLLIQSSIAYKGCKVNEKQWVIKT